MDDSTMQTYKASLLYKAELVLGEGALWHSGWNKLLYVDIEGKKVGCLDPLTLEVKEQFVGSRAGTVVPADNGQLIVALQGSIVELNIETGKQICLIEIEKDKPFNRCNDGKCDAAGRLWVGTMHIDARPLQGALYCYDGGLKEVINNTGVSNGICWSKDNRTMYYIDTLDQRIRSYDFDVTTGSISNERTIVKVTEPGWSPDGMCIDENNMLWVAIWGGGCVHQYDPLNGKLLAKVVVNAPYVTSCAFGGEDLQRLYITTAKKGLSKEVFRRYPLSGSIFHIDTGIGGLPSNIFRVKA